VALRGWGSRSLGRGGLPSQLYPDPRSYDWSSNIHVGGIIIHKCFVGRATASRTIPGNSHALIFWYWMWGVPGAILAVPMLAIAKIICDRIQKLAALGHFLEG
jgi:hypothetical protein